MSHDEKNNTKGAMLALAGMGVFATHDVVVKMLGADGISAFQIVFFAALLSFPIVSIFLVNDKQKETLKPQHPYLMTLRAACTITTAVSAFYAFTTLPLAQVYAILFSSPLLVTMLSIPVLGEKVGLHRWGAVVVGLIGVLVVLQPGGQPLSVGHGAAMLAAICGATAAVLSRKISRDERSVVMLLFPMIGNFVVMGIAQPFVYQPLELEHLGMLFIIATFGLAGSYFVIQAYRIGEATIIAPMQYSQIIWATFYGLLLFDERLDLNTVVGAGIIILSGTYIVLREGRGASKNNPVSHARVRSDTVSNGRFAFIMRILK